MSPGLRAAGRRRYVSLTSFRRSGAGVPTAVWVAPAGEALVVVTGAGEGKTKRLRHDPRVELRECSVSGRVAPGAPVVHGVVEIVTDPAAQAPLLAALHRKYGWQLTAYRAIERRLRPDGPGAVVLRITDA
jgi:uncharacterized protein